MMNEHDECVLLTDSQVTDYELKGLLLQEKKEPVFTYIRDPVLGNIAVKNMEDAALGYTYYCQRGLKAKAKEFYDKAKAFFDQSST